MLSTFRTQYLRTRVTAIRHKLVNTSQNLMGVSYSKKQVSLYFTDTFNYHESIFLANMVRNDSLDTSSWTTAEQELYQEGVEALDRFYALDQFIVNMNTLQKEVKVLSYEASAANKVYSVISYSPVSTPEFVEEVKDVVERYFELMQQIEDKDWKTYVQQNLGYDLHMLCNQHCMHQDHEVFQGLDMQEFFK